MLPRLRPNYPGRLVPLLPPRRRTRPFLRPPPAYISRHSGDRSLNPLLSLPQLVVFLQCGVVVLFELVPKGTSLFDALTDGESTLGISLGCNRSRLSSQ